MSTSMFLLLLVNVLCFAQNLCFTTSVSCDLKSSKFKEVCYKTFLRRSSCCIAGFLELVQKYRHGSAGGKLRKVNKRRFLDVQNVSVPLFYIEITVALTGFK